jgi:hypothetical protein
MQCAKSQYDATSTAGRLVVIFAEVIPTVAFSRLAAVLLGQSHVSGGNYILPTNLAITQAPVPCLGMSCHSRPDAVKGTCCAVSMHEAI